MKPIFQSDTSITGNCFQASICSILEAELDDIPNFTAWGDDWAEKMQEWFGRRGLFVLTMVLHEQTPWYPIPSEPWAIFVGLSEAGVTHAVVGKCEGAEFVIHHDPHPNGKGIDKVDSVVFILPLDPATLKSRLVLEKPTILRSSVIPSGVKHKHRFRDNGK